LAKPLPEIKIVQRTKFFSQNALTNLFAKRTIKAPVRSMRLRSVDHEFPAVEFTSTRSRGRDMKVRTILQLAEWFIGFNIFTYAFHDKGDGQLFVSAETILNRY
jgi:hypothetical protein